MAAAELKPTGGGGGGGGDGDVDEFGGATGGNALCGPSDGVDTFANERFVYANEDARNASSRHYYPNNYVSTSKYTLLTFLPKNLYEQFSKAANFYFLLIAILVLIPGVSSIEPYTSILPLLFVLSVTAIKEAIEDVERHRSDNETNTRLVQVVRPGGLLEDRKWQDILVGDIVRVRDGEELPADMVLLSSSEETGEATIMTANLDGETNLKTKIALKRTASLDTPQKLAELRAVCKCEPPSDDMHVFEGLWLSDGERQAVGNDQVLLRGAKVQETAHVFGLVVYTGVHTKLVLNSSNPRYKRSRVEHVMNRQMYWIFFLQFILVAVCASLSGVWQYEDAADNWYLDEDVQDTGETARIVLRNFGAFYILFSVMVPISLYVSMEMVKVAQSLLIWYDIRMYDAALDHRALARTSNLNEELGQIKYVFSDKTGTLTQNKMSFYKCSAGGRAYGHGVEVHEDYVGDKPAGAGAGADDDDSQAGQPLQRRATMTKRMLAEHTKFEDEELERDLHSGDGRTGFSGALAELMTCLAVCHTVNPVPVVDERTGQEVIDYRGVSIDEVALVVAANEFGFRLKSRDRDGIVIDTPWKKDQRYEIREILDFTSDRKRMSVVARCPDGKYRMFSKGADSIMYARLAAGNDPRLVERTKKHVEEFSLEGLRTLVLARTEMDEAQYLDWSRRYKEAGQSIGNRAEKMDAVADEIECDMRLIGSSAIEDALQERVVETLQNLRAAGMKVWMLTGDKQGTAVNIGKSAGLVDNKLVLRYVLGGSPDEVGAELREAIAALDASLRAGGGVPASEKRFGSSKNLFASDAGGSKLEADVDEKQQEAAGGDESRDSALVIDGPVLTHAMHPDNEQLFFDVINHAKTSVVICSRMAPRQKALVVELVKNNLPVVTLAIGDGANDVSMIQAAHVGVGIRGKEGLQAVNTSDYAIGQFRFLARLLLVHGRLSYKRNTRLILYSFYKSMAITFTQFYFSCISAFSGQEVYDGLLLNTFNLFFASLPIIGLAVFDRDLNPDELMKYPQLYRSAQEGRGFNIAVFWNWLAQGAVHALFVFFIPFWALQELGLWTQSIAVYTALVITVNLKLAAVTTTWTGWNHFFVWGSIVAWFLFGIGLSSEAAIELFPHLFGTMNANFDEPVFWFSLILVGWLSVMFDFVYGFWRRTVKNPHLKLIIQERRALYRQERDAENPRPSFEPSHDNPLGLDDEYNEYDPDRNGFLKSCSWCGERRQHVPYTEPALM